MEAMEFCIDRVMERDRPAVAHRKLPMLLPLIAQGTDAMSPMRASIDLAERWRRDPGIVSVSVVPGFPFSDVPQAGASVLVYAADDAQARQVADDLAATWWESRNDFRLTGQPIDILTDFAGTGPIVVADIADNPGAGAGADATHLLRHFLDHRLSPAGFSCFPDREAVAACHAAGAGAVIPLRIGGKSSGLAGEPVGGRWRIDHLGTGVFINSGPMATGAVNRIGRTATVSRDGISVILCERRAQVVDPAVFEACGIAPDGCRWLVVKSSVHFRAAFRSVATTILEIEGKGLSASMLTDLAYKRVPRPIWPLDPAVGWPSPAPSERRDRE